MSHKQIFIKNKNKKEGEKYILAIVWIVGLIKHSAMDFTNIKLP